jgi:hypothetical protein
MHAHSSSTTNIFCKILLSSGEEYNPQIVKACRIYPYYLINHYYTTLKAQFGCEGPRAIWTCWGVTCRWALKEFIHRLPPAMTPDIDYMPIDNLHQHILHYTAAAVRICLPILMDVLPSVNADDAMTSEAVKTQAKKWSDQEIEDLVDFLYNRHSEASSPGNFKPVVWMAAKLHLDTKHPHSLRTIAAVKAKFTMVHDIIILHPFPPFYHSTSIKICTGWLRITMEGQAWVQCLLDQASGHK